MCYHCSQKNQLLLIFTVRVFVGSSSDKVVSVLTFYLGVLSSNRFAFSGVRTNFFQVLNFGEIYIDFAPKKLCNIGHHMLQNFDL